MTKPTTESPFPNKDDKDKAIKEGAKILAESDKLADQISLYFKKLDRLDHNLVCIYDFLNKVQKICVNSDLSLQRLERNEVWKTAEKSMQMKEELRDISKNLIGLILQFKHEFNYGEKLRALVKEDQYLEQEWNKIVFYIKMKYQSEDKVD